MVLNREPNHRQEARADDLHWGRPSQTILLHDRHGCNRTGEIVDQRTVTNETGSLQGYLHRWTVLELVRAKLTHSKKKKGEAAEPAASPEDYRERTES